jgi:hypothetical protein
MVAVEVEQVDNVAAAEGRVVVEEVASAPNLLGMCTPTDRAHGVDSRLLGLGSE